MFFFFKKTNKHFNNVLTIELYVTHYLGVGAGEDLGGHEAGHPVREGQQISQVRGASTALVLAYSPQLQSTQLSTYCR